jgi:hypothetical protein
LRRERFGILRCAQNDTKNDAPASGASYAKLSKRGFFTGLPLWGFSPVSPFGGDVVGKKTVFTQGVEELEIESHD